MRINLLILFFLGIYFQTLAQNESRAPHTEKGVEEPEDTTLFAYTGEMPKFQGGGDDVFANYIQKNIVYPTDAKEKGIQGKVYIQYIIEKDGSVSNVIVVPGRSLYPSLDQAAIDVIKNSPKWKPGQNNGQPVRVKKIAVIAFYL